MTQNETPPPEVDEEYGEPDVFVGWKVQQYVLAGCGFRDAELLAARRDISTHDVTDLLKSGCPAKTAVAILL